MQPTGCMLSLMTVFEAVSDGTRRQILAQLRDRGPATLSELAEPLPMSRQAVTKHLDSLSSAGLVTVRREGRTRVHELELGPLRELEDWLAPYAAEWDDRLARLQRHLGSDPKLGAAG